MKKRESLSGQIVAANLLLVVAALFAASAASSLDLKFNDQRLAFALLAMTVILALLLNILMLQRRFSPLDELIREIEAIDPSEPGSFKAPEEPVEEVERLAHAFANLLERIEAERRRAGRLQLRAQEEERKRVARDLHDEVNQALTAILLRLEALTQIAPPRLKEELAETKGLANQAMEELLQLARQLRPAALDDHGFVPAIEEQLRRFKAQYGIETTLSTEGELDDLGSDQQLVLYRVTQEALNNVVPARGRAEAWPSTSPAPTGACELSVADDGGGFVLGEEERGLGLEGMAERARLVNGEFEVDAKPGTRHDAEAAGARLMIHALVADDHGIVRSGVRMLLDQQEGISVVAEAEDGVEAVEAALKHKPDVAVLDVSMPRMTGIQATHEIKQHLPDTAVVLLSMHDDQRYFYDALKAGAAGYVLKHSADTQLVDAIRAAIRGEPFMSPVAEEELLRNWLEEGASGSDLTPRELEVVKLIAEAHTNKQIAQILNLSEKTVESHRGNVLSKLGMRDRVELVRYAIRRGLIEP